MGEPKPDPECPYCVTRTRQGEALGVDNGPCPLHVPKPDPEVARLSRWGTAGWSENTDSLAEVERLRAAIAEIRKWGEDADLGDNYNPPTVEAFWCILAPASADQPATREDSGLLERLGRITGDASLTPAQKSAQCRALYLTATRAEHEADQEAGR